jgi:hypothetical protein
VQIDTRAGQLEPRRSRRMRCIAPLKKVRAQAAFALLLGHGNIHRQRRPDLRSPAARVLHGNQGDEVKDVVPSPL